jgi:hypothetical protein
MLRNYINNHKTEIFTIPVDSIVLTSTIHKSGNLRINHHKDENLVVVVTPLNDGKFNLVVGWNEYMTAKTRGLTEIRCVITNDDRDVFLRKNLIMYPIDQIQIPLEFMQNPPREEKIMEKLNYFRNNCRFKRKIQINPSGVLEDGYATYIAAQRLGLKKVPIKCI